PIEPALRSLISVRVAQINGCAFCVDINSAAALGRGGDHAKLAALADFATSALFSDREKLALAYAEAVTYLNRRPSAEDFERLQRHFDDNAVVELTGLIAFQNLSSKFNAALGVEAQGFCVVPSPDKDPSSNG
ncbi:MAG: carboxymuconolactone decarboxylase family protein, partial [Acidiferrobacterales bacterium]